MTDTDSDGPHEQEIVEFELIGNRHPNHDMNTMVELTSFQSLGRMQPFTVTMSSSAMAVIDVHAHLSTSEIVGYLAGQWDVTNHNLIVSHALPVRCRLGDGEKGSSVEKSLYDEMEKLNLSLVGWYHTHPFSPPLPTLRDIDSQLEYEMKMKGSNDASYTPCIGIIVAPYVRGGGQGATTSGFWVMPPPEHKPQEYGRPMSIQFTIVQDAFIPKDALIHVRDTVKYYKDSPDCVVFTDIFQDRHTYWDKLKTAIRLCVPKDHFGPLLDYLAKLLELKNYVNETNSQNSKTKTPVSGAKQQVSDEVVPDEPSVTSSTVSVLKETSPAEVTNDIENLQTSTTPDSLCPTDVMSEPVKVPESPPVVQPMEVSINPEPERSPKKELSPQNPSEPEPKEDYQSISYQRQSPPPYQPPPYQPPQYHPPQYQPPQDDTSFQEPKQDILQPQDFYKEDYKQKHQEQLDEFEREEEGEDSNDYTEPPPDYHQQHFTISSSFEPPSSDSYILEDPNIVHLTEKSVSENLQSEEEETQRISQFSDSLDIDPWPQRLSDVLQAPHQQSLKGHQEPSHQSPLELLQQSQLHQLHQQAQSQQLHQSSQSLQSQSQLHQQLQSQLHKQSQPQLHQQSQPEQLHQPSQSQHGHQQSQSQVLHQQTQPQQLTLAQHLLQPSQLHQQLLLDSHSEHDVLQQMDVDSHITQSEN